MRSEALTITSRIVFTFVFFFHDKRFIYKSPEENVLRGQIWRTNEPGNGSLSSCLTTRNFPVQKVTNTKRGVKWSTIWLGHSSHRDTTQALFSIMARKVSPVTICYSKKKEPVTCFSSKLTTRLPSVNHAHVRQYHEDFHFLIHNNFAWSTHTWNVASSRKTKSRFNRKTVYVDPTPHACALKMNLSGKTGSYHVTRIVPNSVSAFISETVFHGRT